jgi:glycosyltransferase involved in cell wall biosynthesis
LRGGDVPGFSPAETGLYHKILSPINKVIWKNASFITANSEGLKKLALNFFNYKPIEIIYNGVNVKLFKNLEFLKKENKKTVKLLFVGRLAKQKNLFNFIKYVFNDFIKKKKLNVTFTIIGDGPEKVVLKNLIEKLELKEFIEIENWQPREKLAEIYNNFDLFVMPSLYEGMSNVVIEAKLCGLKVVGFDIAGNKELFEKDKDIIIENENYKMMIEKICELINSNNLNKNVSKEFLDKFSMEKISTKFIKLIEGCEN